MGLFFTEGKLVRNLKTNTWQKMVLYYDYQGRVIQDFHLTNLNKLIRKDNQYRFNGELLKLRIVKKNNATVLSTKIMTYEYDHEGRKIKYKYLLNGNERTLVKLDYDDIGRMKTKAYSPSTPTGSKQTGIWLDNATWLTGSYPTLSDQVTINAGHTVTIPSGNVVNAGMLIDNGILKNFGTLNLGNVKASTPSSLHTLNYQYNIRNGLKGINTDANNDLTNSLFSYRLEYEDDGTYFDGNIRKQTWKSNLDNVTRSYSYNYDGASRITQGLYTSTKANENYNMNSVSYDANGNITNLSRNGLKSNNTFGLIDNLDYTYNANSNKILKVDDSSNETASFKDVSGNDYEYWADGSLRKDNNKEITQIDYNYLKLPEQITLTGGRWIKYDYDADGTKLKKTLSTGKVTDYEEDDIYEDGILYQTAHDEGRIVGGVYEYNITDHLGNLRVAFKDSLGIAKAVQYENRGAWGESLEGIGFSKPNKNRYSYSTYENQEDFGINVFDAYARMYDATAPRFWQIDPLAEERMWVSPYNYAQNNPILRIDPDGALDLTFNFQNNSTAEQDRTDLQNHINQGLGGYLTATIGSDGKVTLTPVAGKDIKDASSEVQAFSGAIGTAVSSATNVTIGVVNNSLDVSTGDYPSGKIDIADINAYGNIQNTSGVTNAASPQSKLAHEVTEQTGRQEGGLKGLQGFDALHLKAVGVENNVIGNGVKMQIGTDTDPTPAPGGQYSQSDYKVGRTGVTVTLFEKNKTTIVVQQKK